MKFAKIIFWIAGLWGVLLLQHRIHPTDFGFGCIDLLFGLLFYCRIPQNWQVKTGNYFRSSSQTAAMKWRARY